MHQPGLLKFLSAPCKLRGEMSIDIGANLGSHQITELLGQGGMGQVYRALDAKLKREVAIKILPDEFSGDSERVSRFQLEAQALAALNHENIAAIYDLEEASGISFLVLELVEGDTLAGILKTRGALPLDEALNIASQIAEGLAAAHEKGVIHRDLKPANIKITPDGKVKLLDFGLARMFNAPDEKGDLANSPTIMSRSMPGMIVGTASYMSPEQARGKSVDKRADIWAFGVVLYEMLTGERLFPGEDVSETLASVIMKEPQWERIPAPTRRLLRSCLRRDRKDRLRDIGDAKLLLEEAAAAEPARSVAKSKVPWIVAATFLVLSIALGASLWRATRVAEPIRRPLIRLNLDFGPEGSTGNTAPGSAVAISPDGTRLAYTSRLRVFTRRLDQPDVFELTGTENAYAPFFSPDNRWIAFFTTDGKLKKVSVDGGAAAILTEVAIARGGSWAEDGSILISAGPPALLRVPAGGGKTTPITQPERGELSHRWPQILPGGKAVLFTSHTSATDFDQATIEVMTFADGRRKEIHRGGTYGRYIPTPDGKGYFTYISRGTLFAAPFDRERLELTAAPVRVLEGVAYSPVAGFAHFDFSQTGTLIYQSGGAEGGGLTQIQWLDAAGKSQPLRAEAGFYGRPSLSPDGRRLAVEMTDRSSQDIWVYEWQRDIMSRVTLGGLSPANPVWTPDSRTIVFLTPAGIFSTGADGGGKPQQWTQSKVPQYPWSFTPDSKRLGIMELSAETSWDLWTLTIETEATGFKPGKPEPFLQTAADERYPSFSPDGRWLAYGSSESGVFQIYVRAFPDNGSRVQVSSSGGAYPMWSRASHELFFEALDNRMMVASYTIKGDTLVFEKPRVWSEKKLSNTVNVIRNYDLAADGKRVAALVPVESPEQQSKQRLIFLENFIDELARRTSGH